MPMNNEKALALLLLDLCAFGCSLADDEGSRREFEAACRVVEKDFPFDAQVYRAHVGSLTRGNPDGDGELEQRAQDSL